MIREGIIYTHAIQVNEIKTVHITWQIGSHTHRIFLDDIKCVQHYKWNIDPTLCGSLKSLVTGVTLWKTILNCVFPRVSK